MARDLEILNIPIDNLSRTAILERLKFFLQESKFHRIATINPEFLLLSEKDPKFRAALKDADMRIADGFGITLAFLLKGEKLRYRFPGADLMEVILQKAEEENLSVYLSIRKGGLSSLEEIKAALLKKYPQLVIDGADIDAENFGNWKLEIGNCAIVLCNFGIPTQELYLTKLRNKTDVARVAMGVGGSFDYLTGKQKRAPRWLRAVGFEWLWRLIQQPKRWRRIWNAVIVFPFRLIFATIVK